MGVIVEFVGAPGSGKTSALAALEDLHCTGRWRPVTTPGSAREAAARTGPGAITTRLVPDAHRDRALWVVFRLVSGASSIAVALARPRLLWWVLRTQWRRPAGADARRRRVSYWFFRMLGTRAMLARTARARDVVLLDEGLLHRAVQLLSSPVERPEAAAVERYLDRIPLPDVAVCVETAPETCAARVHERGVWSRLGHRSAAEIDAYVANAHRAADLVRASLAARGVTVVVLANDGDHDALLGQVRERLAPVVQRALADGVPSP